MAITTGKDGSIYIRSTVTAMVNEAAASVAAGVYQITDSGKRIIDFSGTAPDVGGSGTIDKTYMDNGWDYFTGKFKLTEGTGQVPTVVGNYVTITQIGYIYSWTLNAETTNGDITAIGQTWGDVAKTGNKATVTLNRYRFDAELAGSALASTFYLLKLYEETDDGWWVKGLQTSYGLTKSTGAVDDEAISYAVDGPISTI